MNDRDVKKTSVRRMQCDAKRICVCVKAAASYYIALNCKFYIASRVAMIAVPEQKKAKH